MNKISNREKKELLIKVLTSTDWGIQIPIDDKEEYSQFAEYLNVSDRIIFSDKPACKLSGMAFSARQELLNSFMNMDDDVIIIDPEADYSDSQA